MRIKIRAITLALLGLCNAPPIEAQQYRPGGEVAKSNKNSTLNMHLCPKGPFEIGEDQWGKIIRVNMLKIKDWSQVPGVKKAWIMKGYEGEEGMAFHPAISEVKDVDGDGKLDVFRCRSEHEDARIERLRYADDGVVRESEPTASLYGDESRLPVYDLHGESVYSVLHATKGGSWSHAMPGGHEGVRRQVDLDGNGRADVIMPFGAWHWGSDATIFLMEASVSFPGDKYGPEEIR